MNKKEELRLCYKTFEEIEMLYHEQQKFIILLQSTISFLLEQQAVILNEEKGIQDE